MLEQVFEAIMVILFGISWPLNIVKSYKSRTAKGKSLLFLLFIFVGYIFGISAKIYGIHVENKEFSYVLCFYFINLIMVGIDVVLYFRNTLIDKSNEKNNR